MMIFMLEKRTSNNNDDCDNQLIFMHGSWVMGHGWVERMMIFMLEKRISIPMMPGQPRCQYQ